MHEMRQHIRFYSGDKAVISVAYGPADQTPSLGFLTVVKEACVAFTLFKNAASSLHESGFICDSVPILFKRQVDSVSVVEVINLDFRLADSLFERLEGVNLWGRSEAFMSLSAAWCEPETARTETNRNSASLGDFFLRAGRVVIASASHAAAQAITAIKAPVVGGNSRQTRVLPNCFEDLARACNKFFHSFSPTISSLTDLLIEEFLMDDIALSLGHILDREVEMIFLNGAELPQPRRIGGRFFAHLQELTCLGDMTQGPVLVFEELRSAPSANDLPVFIGKAPCNLRCSLEDVMYIWGRAKVEFADVASYSISMVQIGGGILYPTQPGGQSWHWMPENDPAIPNALEALEKNHPKISGDRKKKIQIGSLSTNRDCPLSTEDGQRVLSSILLDHFRSLHACAAHWQLDSIQGGMQGGQYIISQFMLGWNKKPGQTENQNPLNPTNNTLLPELSNLYGLQISLCTGLMYRVPLQRLIASRVESYVRSRSPSVAEWCEIEEGWQMLEAFYESDLEKWFRKLPKEYHPAVWMLVKEILCQLQHTGIDHENMLRIG